MQPEVRDEIILDAIAAHWPEYVDAAQLIDRMREQLRNRELTTLGLGRIMSRLATDQRCEVKRGYTASYRLEPSRYRIVGWSVGRTVQGVEASTNGDVGLLLDDGRILRLHRVGAVSWDRWDDEADVETV